MKKIYVCILLNILFDSVQAQTFSWAKREGLDAYDYGYGVVTDNSGNVYVAGKYEDNANFSGTILPCAGNHDIYLAKYSSAGSLLWIRTGGGLLGDYAHDVSTDGTNYVYVAGEIEGSGLTVTFPGSSITLTANGDNDVFVSKYMLDGTLLWAKSEGSWHSEKAQGVTQDNSGNVYITGYFTDTTIFGGTVIPGAGGEDMFIAKYDAAGALQWMKHAGGPGRDEGKSIKCDAAGDIYICGLFSDGAIFGSTTYNTAATPSGHYYDAYVAKYSPSGSIIWVKTFGSDYDDVAWSLTLDNAGKVYVAGEFNAYATFDGFHLTTAGNSDVFVAALDPTAGGIQWVTQAGGPLIDRARGIGTDGTNLFITGQYGTTALTTASFGSHLETASDSSDIFISGLSNTGTFNWVLTVGGTADSVETLGYESGNAVTATAAGEVYATGSLLNGGIFGTTPLTAYSRTDVFVAKISEAGVGIDEVNSGDNLRVYPNPTNGIFSMNVTDLNEQKFEMTIQDCLGQIVKEKVEHSGSTVSIDLSGEQKGIYFVTLRTNDGKLFKGKILLQ